jgi:TolB-like protein
MVRFREHGHGVSATGRVRRAPVQSGSPGPPQWPHLAPAAARAVVRRRIESIAVLPLQDRCAEPGLQFFVDGMTDALIAELSRVQALRVISPTSVMRYLGTTKTAPEIASELGVDALLEGSVMLVRGTVRVQAHLIDPVSDRHVWSGDYDRPTEDVLVLNRDSARAIVDDIHVQLSAAERAQLNEVRSVMPGAHALWLQGR